MSGPKDLPITLAAMYEAAVRDLADLDAYRLRLLGRADTLRELCDGGLGDLRVAEPLDSRPHEGDNL